MMKNSNSFSYKGYIEGYYGKILNWNDRKRILKQLNLNEMNTYFYASKEDIFHRLYWRRKYPVSWRRKFRSFCKTAKNLKIRVIVGLSPGLDFDFKSCFKNNQSFIYSNDFYLLLQKFKQLINDGADEVTLLFDDIPNDFEEKYERTNEGLLHGILSNELKKFLSKPLSIVPRIYSDELKVDGKFYLENFLKILNRNIKIFYCGKYIVSKTFASKLFIINKKFSENKIIVWDNYYANDYCPKKLFLGLRKIRMPRNILFNLTGLINTDLLIIKILSLNFQNKINFSDWKSLLEENKVPDKFFKIYKFFNEPSFSSENYKKNKLNFDIINDLDVLLWKWKTPLSREWYPYLLILKQDIQIMNNEFTQNRILKTQTYPLQKILLKK